MTLEEIAKYAKKTLEEWEAYVNGEEHSADLMNCGYADGV